jgi:hypothetical protein
MVLSSLAARGRLDVLGDRHRTEHGAALEGDSDLAAQVEHGGAAEPPDVMAEQPDGAGVRSLQPDEIAQQRALARAAAAHDHHDLALQDRQAHVEQDLPRAVVAVEMLHLDDQWARWHFGDRGVRRGGLEAHFSASR